MKKLLLVLLSASLLVISGCKRDDKIKACCRPCSASNLSNVLEGAIYIDQSNITYQKTHETQIEKAEIIREENSAKISICMMATSGSITPKVEYLLKTDNNISVYIDASLKGDAGTMDIVYWNIEISTDLDLVNNCQNVYVFKL